MTPTRNSNLQPTAKAGKRNGRDQMRMQTTLSSKFSLRGLWWLPELPGERVPGTLVYDPDGENRLELDGCLPTPCEGVEVPLVHGHTTDDRCCTLVQALPVHWEMRYPGGGTSSLVYHQLLIGGDTITPGVTQFVSAVVDFTCLRAWIAREPFTDDIQESSGRREWTTTYCRPARIEMPLPSIDATICFEASFNKSQAYQERRLTHAETVRITPRTARDAEWYSDVVSGFRILLGLLADRPVNIRAIGLSRAETTGEPENANPVPESPYDWCFSQVAAPSAPEPTPPDIALTFSRLGVELPSVLDNWYGKQATLKTAAGLHFGVSVRSGLPVEFRLLALVQALESLHRGIGGQSYLPDEHYAPLRDELVAAIPAGVPSDLREALKSKLQYGNEYSLRKRLALSLELVPDELRGTITGGDAGYVSRIVAARNYLTHRDQALAESIRSPRELMRATGSLRRLVGFLLLREAGVSIEVLTRAFVPRWSRTEW